MIRAKMPSDPWHMPRPELAARYLQVFVEYVERGRGTRYQLSHHFYTFSGQPGVDKRRYELARDANKALLLQHIISTGARGAELDELQQLLPDLSRDQVRTLLRELQRAGHVEVCGSTKGARWVQTLEPDSA